MEGTVTHSNEHAGRTHTWSGIVRGQQRVISVVHPQDDEGSTQLMEAVRRLRAQLTQHEQRGEEFERE